MTPTPASPARAHLTPALERLARLLARSQRKREICLLLLEGKRSKEIAGALGIATGTIDTHIKQMFSALDLHDRTFLVRLLSIHFGDTVP